ncbi:MAG: MFS transporter [Actinomycetota bacterium]|nr:MFS transporter [Actinomycetota bacterium]
MLILVVLAVGVCLVPLFGGQFGRLAELRLKMTWALFLSLLIQVAIISVVPTGPIRLLSAAHVISYVLAGVFVIANRHIPGWWVMAVGGVMNLAAIAANGGVMPASAAAFHAAGIAAPSGVFLNSEVVSSPNLKFLGDVFSVGAPIRGIFSIGDLLLVAGGLIAIHTLSGSRLIPSGRGEFTALGKHRQFMRMWSGLAVSNLGDWIYGLAVAVVLVRRTGSAHALAILLICQVGFGAVAGFLCGPLIDRLSRKLLMAASDLLRAAALLLLLVGSPSPVRYYVVAALLGTFEALFLPSFQASIPNLVPEERIVAANALTAVTFNFSVMIGPLLGGFLISNLGIRAVIVVDAASFLVSSVLIWSTALSATRHVAAPSSALADLREGIRYSLETPLVRWIFLVTGLFMVGAAIKAPLEPLFILRTLGQPADALGLIGGAWGLGMLFGSASAPSLTKRFSRQDLLWVSILFVGGSVMLASRSPTLTPVLLLWLIAGAGNALGTIAYETLLQQGTPNEFRGRVFAASEGVLNVCYLVGVAVAGGLGDWIGIRWSLVVAGAVFVGAGLLSRRLLTPRPPVKERHAPGPVILEQGYLLGVPAPLPDVAGEE